MPSGVKKIREELGMSQELMAGFLGIGRPTLALAETGKRILPTAALIKLNQLLHIPIESNLAHSAKAIATMAKQAGKQKAEANKKMAKLKLQAKLLQRQLKNMQQAYGQCNKALQTSAYILPRLNNTQADRLDRDTLQLMEMLALKKAQHCSPATQALLALRINLLNMEAEELAKLFS
jgi:transcriptional regulator with XRE-family HTH domain